MNIAFLIGRILFGGYFAFTGFNHLFSGREMMTGYAKFKGVPVPGLAVIGTGLLLLTGGLSIMTGFLPIVGAVALILFFIPTNFMIHNFWAVKEEEKMGEMTHFMKNTALLGASIMILYISSIAWPLSI